MSPDEPGGEHSDAAQKLEEEHAPDCDDCGRRTDLRGIQESGTGTGYLIQWICPECEPDRVQIASGIPEGFEIVPTEPDDQEQKTLAEAVTDGGTSECGRDRRDPSEDPHACSVCGVYIGFGADEYCDGCAREIGAKPPLVQCMGCGQEGPREQMETIDISRPGEYYPAIRYLCRGCSGGESA